MRSKRFLVAVLLVTLGFGALCFFGAIATGPSGEQEQRAEAQMES
jgi:hypothetical protein